MKSVKLLVLLITWACAVAHANSLSIDARADALRSGEYGRLTELVFSTRNHVSDGHWYANFGYYCSSRESPTYGKQGRLCVWNLQTGALRLLIDDSEGGVRDPCVSYDAKKSFSPTAPLTPPTTTFTKSPPRARTCTN